MTYQPYSASIDNTLLGLNSRNIRLFVADTMKTIYNAYIVLRLLYPSCKLTNYTLLMNDILATNSNIQTLY